MCRTAARFDSSGHFISEALYPCVRKKGGVASEVVLFVIRYSSLPMENTTYANFPLASGQCWHVQSSLVNGDTDTCKSVTAAMEACAPWPGSYLSTNCPATQALRGSSLGMAVVAAILGIGAGKYAFTGWITGFGPDQGEFVVGPVDGTSVKIAHCHRERIPLFVGRTTLMNDRTTEEKCALGRYYRFADYLKGIPFKPLIYEAIEVSTLSEAMLMAGAMQMRERAGRRRKRQRQ